MEYEKKKVLHVANKNALRGGVGTVIGYLQEGINHSSDFESDTLFTTYSTKNRRPGPVTLSQHGNKTEKTLSQGELEEKLQEYDIVHVHGLPHYNVLEALENVKRKGGKQPKIVNTAHSSVKQEFLAQYEAAEKSDDPETKKDLKGLKYLRDKRILEEPGPFADTYWGSAIHRQEKIMTMSDSVQHMSETYKNDLIQEYRAEENAHKHSVIPNGVRHVKDPKPRPGKKRLLFVGRFAKEKGIDEFVDAIPKIFEKHPDAEVKFVGGDKEGKLVDKYRNKLKKQMEDHFKGKEGHDPGAYMDRIKFTGWITDQRKLQRQYQWTDYLVVPSKAESFCLVASTALMHKRLPIITRTKTMDELYVSKGIAVGIEPDQRNGDGIAKTINETLDKSKSGEHNQMVEKGREFVMKHYSIDTMINKQLDAYRHLTGKKEEEAKKDDD